MEGRFPKARQLVSQNRRGPAQGGLSLAVHREHMTVPDGGLPGKPRGQPAHRLFGQPLRFPAGNPGNSRQPLLLENESAAGSIFPGWPLFSLSPGRAPALP